MGILKKDKEKEVVKTSKEENKSNNDSNESFEDATDKVTRYGVYKGENCIAIISLENHGEDFAKIAKAKAKAVDGVAKPYVDPAVPVVDKNVVKIVNASGSLIREYSKSVHGKDYAKLADSYIEKHGEKRGLSIQA